MKKNKMFEMFINVFVILQPFFDILTSLMVRNSGSSLTVGMLVRALFVCFAAIYILFFYDGKHKKLISCYFVGTGAYGIVNIALSAYYNGTGTIVENGKMFFKMYYFVFVLLFFYAIYQKNKYVVKDWVLSLVFATYTGSILLSAITNTSFVTYLYAKGYCGWFYAGNEVGAIVSILAMVAFIYSVSSKNIIVKIALPVLLCFAGVYIGTKVPFLACTGVIVLTLILSGLTSFIKTDKNSIKTFASSICVLLVMVILFFANSPVKQNNNVMMNEHFDSHVTEKLESDENEDVSSIVSDPENSASSNNEDEKDNDDKPNKLFLVANWLLSDRLVMSKPAFNEYTNGTTLQKLFGLGYAFKTGAGIYSNQIEMDYFALLINHGIIGFLIHLVPVIIFAFICVKHFFKNIKNFFSMGTEIGYIYSILIALCCAFIAGHVLVSPSVSIYLAILIIKLFAALESNSAKCSDN